MPNAHSPLSSSPPAPLWAVYSLTFSNSIASGVVSCGISFLTTSAYGFKAQDNFRLGLVYGATYIAGALLAGPVIRRLRGAFPSLSSRAILGAIFVLLGAISLLPPLAAAFANAGEAGAGSWPVWILMALYTPLTGALWPMTESYLSGGRRAGDLRHAIGGFNIVWSSALVGTMWGMAPLLKHYPIDIFYLVAAIHVAGIALIPAIGRDPARHLHDEHEPHPPVYNDLLPGFRTLLVVSYLLFAALSPYFPSAMFDLHIPGGWATAVTSIWLVSRVFTFATLQWWHGWHGRWSAAIFGGVLLFSGFVGAVLSPRLEAGVGQVAMALSLVAFGIGMGTIYTGALYYAMEVGSAEVDAGGMHEALIGLGYFAGPLCGVAAYAAADYGYIAADRREPAMIALAAVLTLPAAARLVRLARHSLQSS